MIRGRVAAGFLLACSLCLLAEGCSPQWRRKFIRKRKNVEPPQAVLVLQTDLKALHPPHDRYREHFALWKTWHTELLDSYGQIRKRDIMYLSGVIGELRALQQLLQDKPSGSMREILVELNDLQARWAAAPNPWGPSAATRSRLEQLLRRINRDFQYSNVISSIRPDPE